ncbi:MAG: hypothetical protein OIF48_13030, partial [Silicimonas sp.]|nr:hypothetical protein [Silicimonas sp.]
MTQMTATPATAPTAFLAEGDAPIFNVFQIIFLNLIGFYSLTCAALLLEVHWIKAVLIGWLGGGVFALAIIAITLGLA